MNNYLSYLTKIYRIFVILSLAALFSFKEGYAQVTILPLGDSITKGIEDNGDAPADSGYRSFLYKKLALNSYSVNFVGDSLNPEVPTTPDYDRYHQGLAGLRVNGNAIGGYPGPPLVDSVGNYLRRHPAEIVLLHMGTNDITNPAGQPTLPIKVGIGTVLDSINSAAPDAIVILARIVNRDPDLSPQSFIDSTTALNIQLQDFDSLSYVYVVDMESALDYSTDMANRVHPNSSGYEKIADVWYDQITYIIDNVLPVELTVFTATKIKNGVLLQWNTATELNNYGFEIERMNPVQNKEWKRIGIVEGAGNSSSPKSYSFNDLYVPSGNLKYRLKQIDNNGQFEYSNIVEINLSPNSFALEQNYPNPFNPSTTIEYYIPEKGFVNLSVFNSLGQEVVSLVNEIQRSGKHKIDFNAGNLASGIYYYKISAGSNLDIKKLVLLK